MPENYRNHEGHGIIDRLYSIAGSKPYDLDGKRKRILTYSLDRAFKLDNLARSSGSQPHKISWYRTVDSHLTYPHFTNIFTKPSRVPERHYRLQLGTNLIFSKI